MPDPTALPLVFASVGKVYEQSHLGRTTRQQALRSASFEIRAGEIFGLLGLNGSGKTTTFKIALGLIQPSQGEARLFGLSPARAQARRKAGYLPEVPVFSQHLSCEQILAFYGGLSGLGGRLLETRIADTLDLCGLKLLRRRRVRELSKGYRQRLGLAQAILHNPELLILDEPASGLDPLAILEMRRAIEHLNGTLKTSILLSSHSISEIERLCDRVAILREGRLVKVLEKSAWKEAQGGLEDIFVAAVAAPLGARESA